MPRLRIIVSIDSPNALPFFSSIAMQPGSICSTASISLRGSSSSAPSLAAGFRKSICAPRWSNRSSLTRTLVASFACAIASSQLIGASSPIAFQTLPTVSNSTLASTVIRLKSTSSGTTRSSLSDGWSETMAPNRPSSPARPSSVSICTRSPSAAMLMSKFCMLSRPSVRIISATSNGAPCMSIAAPIAEVMAFIRLPSSACTNMLAVALPPVKCPVAAIARLICGSSLLPKNMTRWPSTSVGRLMFGPSSCSRMRVFRLPTDSSRTLPRDGGFLSAAFSTSAAILARSNEPSGDSDITTSNSGCSPVCIISSRFDRSTLAAMTMSPV